MHLAASRVVLDFYGNFDVNKKHAEVLALIREIQKRFNVSIAEVEDFQDPERCVIGVSQVAASERDGRERIQKVLDYLDSHSFARVVSEDTAVSMF